MEEWISEIEDQLIEIKLEDKIKEKGMNKEIWDHVKRPNLCLIGIPKSDRENGTKLENALQDITRRTSPTQQDRPIFTFRKYREHHKNTPQEEQPQETE